MVFPALSFAYFPTDTALELHKAYTFTPHSARTFKNPLLMKATIHCAINTPEVATVGVNVLNKSVSVNHQSLHSHQTLTIHAPDQSHYRIRADKKAKVEVTNLGEQTFRVNCHL